MRGAGPGARIAPQTRTYAAPGSFAVRAVPTTYRCVFPHGPAVPAAVAFAGVIRRGVLVAAVALMAVAALSTTSQPERPVATVGHAGVEKATTTTAAPPPAPATTTTIAKVGATTRSTTVVRSGGGSLTVVNESSASASTGGNVVIGPPDATVVNGPATAVGNVSRP